MNGVNDPQFAPSLVMALLARTVTVYKVLYLLNASPSMLHLMLDNIPWRTMPNLDTIDALTEVSVPSIIMSCVTIKIIN